MKKLFFAALLIWAFCISASAQTATSDTARMSLQQCIDYALANQVNIRNARLDEEISMRHTQEVTGLALPQIDASLDVTDFLKLPTSLIPAEFFGGEPGTFAAVQFGTQWNATASLQASQLVLDGRYFLGLKAARALADLSSLDVHRNEIETVEAVMKAYLSSLIAERRLQQLDVNITRFKKLFEDTKALYQAGFVEKLDVDRITVNYNNLITEKGNVERLTALSSLVLKFQMGMDVNRGIFLTDSIGEDNFEAVLQNSGTPDLNNRVEYQQLLTGKSLAQMDVQRYNIGYLPSLYAFGSLSYQAQREEFNFFNNGRWYSTGLIGLKLSLPIFDGLQKARQVQQARLSLQKSENNIENFRNAMNLQVSSAEANMQNAISRLTSQKSNLDLAKEVVDISRKKFELGAGSSLEVTDAEGSLKDAETNYLSALYDAWIARIDLQKAFGSLYK
ncbi:MAG: TolC family protein [Chitinophagales bacterium]|nr:TolC family protein [Chitinophagales bacterium]